MTPLIPQELRQAITGGHTLHPQRKVEGERSFVPSEIVGSFADPGFFLVRSLFCTPQAWWQQVTSHPQATIVPIFLHRGYLVIGPGFQQGEGICPTCATLRLAQAFPDPLKFTALLSGHITQESTGASLETLWAILSQGTLADFAITHHDRLKSGSLATVPLSEEYTEVLWHHILPPPGDHPFHEIEDEIALLCDIPDIPWSNTGREAHDRPDRLSPVDAFVGPLLTTANLPAHAGEPPGIASAVTLAGHLGKFTKWHPDVSGSGLAFSGAYARGASLGEAVERYSGNYIPLSRLISATEGELERTRRPYVSLERFSPFTREQKAKHTWPFAVHTNESCIPWIEASILGEEQETTLLPAEAVFLGLARVTKQQSRVPVPLAGIAAHTSQEAATTAALLEVIERDSSVLWWHGGYPARLLVALPRALQEQVERDVPQAIRQWYLLLSTDMPGFTVAGCLHDQEHDILVLGFATRTNLADALRKASAESWQLRRLSLQLLDRGSALWRDIDRGRLPMPTRPFRPDRRYAESFREDFADMHQLTYNTQFFLDPRTHPPALARLTGEPCSFAEAEASQKVSPSDLVALCIAHLARTGERLYRVDLTTPDMGQLGLVTLRIACPGLVGNTPTAFLPLGHQRFEEASRRGGQSYHAPMPHA